MSKVTLPAHLSYSQVSTMQHCGEQWRLSRGLHLPEAPAWALVGGSAVHKATETYDWGYVNGVYTHIAPDPKALFIEAFDAQIAEQVAKSPDDLNDPVDWKASGRPSKAWPGKEDEKWWRAHGPEFVANWIRWRTNSTLDITLGDDTVPTGIEMEAETEIAGLPVKVYIDRLMVGPSGLVIIDLKSGSQIPKDGLQLAVYKHALKTEYDIDVPFGQFWDARNGVTTESFSMAEYPPERLDFIFGAIRQMQEAGQFIPHVTNMCAGCGVRRYCYAVGGELAHEVPRPWEAEQE